MIGIIMCIPVTRTILILGILHPMVLMGKGWTSFWYRLELLSLGYSDSYKLYCFHQNYHASTTSELHYIVFLFGDGADDQNSWVRNVHHRLRGWGMYTTESCN